jgi:predicted DNA binding protein
MSLVAEFEVPTGEFALQGALDAVPEMRVEMERLATHSREWVMPFVWASGGDIDDFTSALEDDETVTDVTTLDRLDGTALYKVEWHESVERRVDAMIDQHAIIQEAVADRQWFLKLRFADEDELSDFRTHFGPNFQLRRKYRTTQPRHGEFGLTPEQRETLVLASELGYFSVPRAATVEDIADHLDISANSVSQRLRRAHDALVQNTLLVNGQQRTDSDGH